MRGGDGSRDDGDGEETVVMREKGAFLDNILFLFRLLLNCVLTLRHRITCRLFVIMVALPLPALLFLRSALLFPALPCSSPFWPSSGVSLYLVFISVFASDHKNVSTFCAVYFFSFQDI